MSDLAFYCYGFASGFLIPLTVAASAVWTVKRRRRAVVRGMAGTSPDYSAYRAPDV
ncbi:hypothetical protein AB0451_39515 [Streptomyces sp. NPDC052000]|uniref:hypothetical protein n=1 Tax=Streptomyces sp. NPDC052000 TaxID=3155676 RepID=UPI00344E47DE